MGLCCCKKTASRPDVKQSVCKLKPPSSLSPSNESDIKTPPPPPTTTTSPSGTIVPKITSIVQSKVSDHNLASILHFLSTPEALNCITTCKAMLSASCTRSYCHPILHLPFVPSQLLADSLDESSSESDSDDDDDNEGDGEVKKQQNSEEKQVTMNWLSAISFCQRRSNSISTLRISPPDGIGITILRLQDLVEASKCKQLQIFHGPLTIIKKENNVLLELVKEASRISACQKSYDSEYYHEYNVDMATNVTFLETGGNIEEAETLLEHIENAACSYLNNCSRIGAASSPYGVLQGWVNLRRAQLKRWLPIQEFYNRIKARIHSARSCRLTSDRVRHLLVVFRKIKNDFSNFVMFAPPSAANNIMQYGKEDVWETAAPYNLMKKVLLPLINQTINDLARVNEMLDTIESCRGGDEIEHWMMLNSDDRDKMVQWSGGQQKGNDDDSVDSDDAESSSTHNIGGNGGGITTVGQALDTLRSDPHKFKAFTEMTRHMNEMMRLDA